MHGRSVCFTSRYGCDVRREDGVRVDTNVRSVDVERAIRGHPVRRVHTAAGKKHYTDEFWSVTVDAHLSYESRLELDQLSLANFDDSVRWVATQPFWLRDKDEADVRRHVPDALHQPVSGSYTVADVKPVEFQSRPAVAALLDWTSRVCDAKGWRYEVSGGADAVLLANIHHIGQARRPGLVPDRVGHCLHSRPIRKTVADGSRRPRGVRQWTRHRGACRRRLCSGRRRGVTQRTQHRPMLKPNLAAPNLFRRFTRVDRPNSAIGICFDPSSQETPNRLWWCRISSTTTRDGATVAAYMRGSWVRICVL
jgi:hypothetical protein